MVERRRRQAVATFFAERRLDEEPRIILGEGAAHHARVRRHELGDEVRVTDGHGNMATGRISRIARDELEITVEARTTVPYPSLLVLFVPVADRERMLWLAEKAAELSVSVWQPVVFARSLSVSPRGEGEAFKEKVRARMRAAIEQSGGAWMPQICDEIPVDLAAMAFSQHLRILLDTSGKPLLSLHPRGEIAIAIGPEGGVSGGERECFFEHGWVPASLGSTTLRFETAGIAAAAIARAAQHA